MATLKEHQAAMVDLLANGSGIPASASRLAHAMHDVLSAILSEPDLITKAIAESKAIRRAIAETTPGLNDKALSKPQRTLKTDSPAKWPTPAEQRVKELENTIRQLKANNAKLKKDNEWLKGRMSARDDMPEQAGCRKPDTQVCEHDFRLLTWCGDIQQCSKCGATRE